MCVSVCVVFLSLEAPFLYSAHVQYLLTSIRHGDYAHALQNVSYFVLRENDTLWVATDLYHYRVCV